MKVVWRFVVLGVLAASVALGIFIGQKSRETPEPETAISAVDLTRFFATQLNDSQGIPQALAQWQGKILVINFWASWCAPCREEMPVFSRLQTKYGSNGVQFVGIALDTPANVSAFLQQVAVSYPLLLAESEGTELTRQLGNTRLALPYTVVLDTAQHLRKTRLGKFPEQELDDLLDGIVQEKPR